MPRGKFIESVGSRAPVPGPLFGRPAWNFSRCWYPLPKRLVCILLISVLAKLMIDSINYFEQQELRRSGPRWGAR